MSTTVKFVLAIILFFNAIRFEHKNISINPLGYLALMILLIFGLN